jgi:hypothetical protein
MPSSLIPSSACRGSTWRRNGSIKCYCYEGRSCNHKVLQTERLGAGGVDRLMHSESAERRPGEVKTRVHHESCEAFGIHRFKFEEGHIQRLAQPPMKLAGPLAARSPGLRLGLRLVLALQIERHGSADQILQGRIIDLIAFMDVDGAPDIPVEAGVE